MLYVAIKLLVLLKISVSFWRWFSLNIKVWNWPTPQFLAKNTDTDVSEFCRFRFRFGRILREKNFRNFFGLCREFVLIKIIQLLLLQRVEDESVKHFKAFCECKKNPTLWDFDILQSKSNATIFVREEGWTKQRKKLKIKEF